MRAAGTVVLISVALAAVPSGYGAQPSGASKVPLAELERMGREIAQAVLAKDIDGIVRYGRADLVESDRAELREPGSELTCYLFETSCNFRQQPSVYEVLRKAKRLSVAAVYLGQSLQGRPNAAIVWYDASKATRKDVQSRSYLEKRFGHELVMWRFEYVDGQWRALTALFDAFTD